MVNFASHNSLKPAAQKPRFLRASHIYVDAQPVVIHAPHQDTPDDRLIVKKENGTVKGFQYRCACGRVDHFVCE